jgi:hypothetical protein
MPCSPAEPLSPAELTSYVNDLARRIENLVQGTGNAFAERDRRLDALREEFVSGSDARSVVTENELDNIRAAFSTLREIVKGYRQESIDNAGICDRRESEAIAFGGVLRRDLTALEATVKARRLESAAWNGDAASVCASLRHDLTELEESVKRLVSERRR